MDTQCIIYGLPNCFVEVSYCDNRTQFEGISQKGKLQVRHLMLTIHIIP